MQWVEKTLLIKLLKAVSLFNKKNISKDDYVLNLFGDEKLIKAKLDNSKISNNKNYNYNSHRFCYF